MKHTPGPWHTDDTKSFYVFAHGSLMEQAGVKNGPFICNASSQSNARLIAAAPEMLEAIHVLLNCPDMGWDEMEPESIKAIQIAREAIAKAEGR